MIDSLGRYTCARSGCLSITAQHTNRFGVCGFVIDLISFTFAMQSWRVPFLAAAGKRFIYKIFCSKIDHHHRQTDLTRSIRICRASTRLVGYLDCGAWNRSRAMEGLRIGKLCSSIEQDLNTLVTISECLIDIVYVLNLTRNAIHFFSSASLVRRHLASVALV